MAASLGFEPRQRDPESLVLPLHYEAVSEKIKADLSRRNLTGDSFHRANYGAHVRTPSSISAPSRAPSTSTVFPLFATNARARSTM